MLEKIKQALLYGKDFCEDTAENIKETVVTAMDATKLSYRITAQRNELNALYASLGRNLQAELVGGSFSGYKIRIERRKRRQDRRCSFPRYGRPVSFDGRIS